jgi:hypothetical protein
VASLLLFNGLEDFLMTLCDFEQQTDRAIHSPREYWPGSHRVRGTALGKNSKTTDDFLLCIIDGKDWLPSQRMGEK